MRNSHVECRDPANLELADTLSDLYDELTKFSDCCAFLCDALCRLAAEEDALDTATVEGMRCFAHWMKERVAGIKDKLKRLHGEAHAGQCTCA